MLVAGLPATAMTSRRGRSGSIDRPPTGRGRRRRPGSPRASRSRPAGQGRQCRPGRSRSVHRSASVRRPCRNTRAARRCDRTWAEAGLIGPCAMPMNRTATTVAATIAIELRASPIAAIRSAAWQTRTAPSRTIGPAAASATRCGNAVDQGGENADQLGVDREIPRHDRHHDAERQNAERDHHLDGQHAGYRDEGALHQPHRRPERSRGGLVSPPKPYGWRKIPPPRFAAVGIMLRVTCRTGRPCSGSCCAGCGSTRRRP